MILWPLDGTIKQNERESSVGRHAINVATFQLFPTKYHGATRVVQLGTVTE